MAEPAAGDPAATDAAAALARHPAYALAAPAKAALRRSRHRLVVTGAGGWLGRATLALLADALDEQGFAARVHAFGSQARRIDLGGPWVEQRPLAEFSSLPRAPTIVFHGAFLTKDKAAGRPEAEFRAGNEAIRQTLMAGLDAIGAEGLFLPSSGAVYSAEDPADPALRLYGEMKLADETALGAWAERSGANLVTARIFNLTGPFINKPEHYAIAGFISDALAGRPIAIKADRPVLRSFAAIRELMSLVVQLLPKTPTMRTTFDVAGIQTMEMGDIAAGVAEALNRPAATERPTLRRLPPSCYLSTDPTYANLLAAHGVDRVGFPDQVRDIAAYLLHAERPESPHTRAATLAACN